MNPFQDITISEITNQASERYFMVECRGCFMEANELTASLLLCLKDFPETEDGIKHFCSMYKSINVSVVHKFVEAFVKQIETGHPEKKRTFLYQKEVLDSVTVDKIARELTFLFNKRLACAIFSITLILDIGYLIVSPNLIHFSGQIDALTLLGVIVFLLVSSMIHEFGHATAANKYGINTGGIGVGLYINFPVFYTDVTKIWRLSKTEKCIVNLGGIYFQLILITVAIVAHQIFGLEVLRYLIIVTNFSFLLNLNPFFKFDGYWLISDLAGVPNLRKKSRYLIRYLVNKLHRKSDMEWPYLLGLRGSTRYLMLTYAIVVNFFMLYYLVYIIPLFLWSFVHTIPSQAYQFVTCLSNNIMPPFALVHNLFSELLFFALISYMVYRYCRNYVTRNFGDKSKSA